MKNLKILIACEESQTVCKAFRNKGFEAYSCDIQRCSGGHPEWHFLGDCIEVIRNKGGVLETGTPFFVNGEWDLIIAHPPCTYLSNAGAGHLFPKGVLNKERYEKGLEAKAFFMKLYNTECKHLAVENPVSSRIFELPKHTQEIQPYMFGHPFSKKTRLWLKGLPLLEPTKLCEKWESTTTAVWFNKGQNRQKARSKTFQGIADAMAEQWGSYISNL